MFNFVQVQGQFRRTAELDSRQAARGFYAVGLLYVKTVGNVVGAGQGQNVAGPAMIRAGISKETYAFTVNKLCASGMKAVRAWQWFWKGYNLKPA